MMKTKGQNTRNRIIKSADALFYQKGYNQTSFAEIAEDVSVPKGNIYYYFKTKDEMFEAVIEYRLEQIQQMLDEWQKSIDTPLARLKCYAEIMLREEQDVLRYGCPMGSLTVELSKTQMALKSCAVKMFDLFRAFVLRQFEELGKIEEAQAYSHHLLAWIQGVSLISNAYTDATIIKNEVARINQWLDGLSTA